jgi:threonyl-tRNA synthetase
LSLEGFDVEVDLSKLTLNNKVRKAQTEQYSYILCCGQKDLDSGSVTVRLRDHEKDIGSRTIAEVLKMFKDQLPKMSEAELAKINNSYYSPEVFFVLLKRIGKSGPRER